MMVEEEIKANKRINTITIHPSPGQVQPHQCETPQNSCAHRCSIRGGYLADFFLLAGLTEPQGLVLDGNSAERIREEVEVEICAGVELCGTC